MRLKHIKLVGFKSFVDPTKVPFPHQMTCVVGPNGCGKSNVIDAVRWVLGESSAKNLRGDAMTDVIFNGSSARKPVSQASVELVFDNSSGRVQGEFANYTDISVKRVVTRDAVSSYYLNGTKCRRRDITDLFLGTGLGPRSYAIIEQGMISRLIESKPQELRVFIEEAAGISKYKERRRETETRIQHTRENLDRLSDVRDELGRQLEKLQRQAQAARRYKTLKADERQVKAQLQALRWLQQEQQADGVRQRLQQAELEFERWRTEQVGSELGSEALRQQEQDAVQALEQVQQQFFQIGTEVTRLEQQLQHEKQLRQQREQRLRQVLDEQQQISRLLDDDEAQLQALMAELTAQEPELALAQATEAERFADAEATEAQWQAFQTKRQEALAQAQAQQRQQQLLEREVERAQLAEQHLGQQRQTLQTQLANLQQQQQALTEQAEASALTKVTAELEACQQQLTAQQQQREQQQLEHQTVQQQLEQQQQQLQLLRGEQRSLERLLQAPDSDVQGAMLAWCTEQFGPVTTVRMALEQLGTINAMQRAQLDAVLSAWLEAPLLQPAQYQAWQQQCQAAGWLGVRAAGLNVAGERAKEPAAAAYCDGLLANWTWLQRIALVTDAKAAQALFNASQADWIAAIGPAGEWYWPGASYWPSAADHAAQQVLQQQHELSVISAKIGELESKIADLSHNSAALATELSTLADACAATTEQRQSLAQDQARLTERAQGLQQRQQELSQQLAQLTANEQELELAQAAAAERVLQTQLELESAQSAQAQTPMATEHALSSSQGEQLQQGYQAARQQWLAAQQQAQQLQLAVGQLTQQVKQGQVLVERAQQQLQQLQAQATQLRDHDDNEELLQELQLRLEEALLQREQVEQARAQASNAVSELQQQLRELQQGQQGVDAKIEQARQAVESAKLELTALTERSRNILQVLDEMKQPLKPILESLPEQANEREWQAELERLQTAINRLGAINLAAIEEADAQAERKQYLDQQHEDLHESLATLETAIRKIDRETRTRFKATFDAVNADLQALFPKVFGGGRAYLELTDDDLLETGVTIMAQPPGKKNSTIHLLSGGEKALTALSLVFAIFRLNPAPFCLLDEVDAPLDDANVGRFCRLVEEMSETVQFIYISHNKVAMEMASHLAGVTMQEAGVSRLVAVDVDEAMAMAQAS